MRAEQLGPTRTLCVSHVYIDIVEECVPRASQHIPPVRMVLNYRDLMLNRGVTRTMTPLRCVRGLNIRHTARSDTHIHLRTNENALNFCSPVYVKNIV